MKKRILALALAGTTAFSVFGGINAFAADEYKWDSAKPVYNDAFASESVAVVPTTWTAETIENISFENPTEDGFEYDGTKFYVYDWKVINEKKVAAFEKTVNAALKDGTVDKTDAKTVKTAFKEAYEGLKDSSDVELAEAAIEMVGNYDDIKDYFTKKGKVDPAKVAVDYDVVDFDLLNAEDLFAAIYASQAKGIYEDSLSYYTYLNTEYDRIMGLVEESDKSDLIDTYEHLLEAASALTESDYSATNWAKVEYDIKLAEANATLAEKTPSKWSEAIQNLRDALEVEPEKGDYTELRDTLMSMYADSKGQTRASFIEETYVGADYAIYKKKDYTVKGKPTDEWNALFKDSIWYYNPLDAMTSTNASGFTKEELCAGVYGYAYRLYDEARDGKKIAQSRLDIANDMLIEAIAALDPTTSSAEWELVKLEKTVALAEALVDTDFNAGSTKWKTFTKNLEKAQEILAKSNASKSEVTNITAALNGSMMALETVAKNPSYTLKKEYLATLKEAKDALKEIEDQNATQYKTLMAAINAAEEDNLGTWLDVNEKDKDCFVALTSDYEEAIAALEAAIAGYEHPQGWYQNENGTWFYGVGTENYTGWLELNGRTYFLQDDGSMAASTWVKTEKGYWYYLNASGAMMHDGWAKINNAWYYFKNFGGMAEGWVKVANTWYYLQPGSGKMVTGWNLINGKYYYFDASGAMLANTTTPDGYKVDASGAWVK